MRSVKIGSMKTDGVNTRVLGRTAMLLGLLVAACGDGGGTSKADPASADVGTGTGPPGGGGTPAPADAAGPAADATSGDAAIVADSSPIPDAVTPDAAPPGPAACEGSDLPVQPFLVPDPADGQPGAPAAEFGPRRHMLAKDFTIRQLDGSSFSFSASWSGCETYVFLTDGVSISDSDATPVWNSDLDSLLAGSPDNVHYLFVSGAVQSDAARTRAQAVQDQLDAVVASLPADAADHWRTHVHISQQAAGDLGGWLEPALRGHGARGFAIDRFQRVRGVGSFADVSRYDQAAADAGAWPWHNNMAYAAYEARRMNYEANLQARLDASGDTIVKLLDGETVAGFQDVTGELPSAAEMANFDTFEVEVEQRCPNGTPAEVGNCGAWDYLAYLWLADDAGNRTELARFITSYHRETHWVVDVSPMLALLKDGGHRSFRWEFAPEWNTQPTATWLRMRFSNRGKGYRPDTLVPIAQGGAFGSAYNDGRTPIELDIPADAKRVELYAVTTGHGAETNQCAEFCNHQHEYTVNGHRHLQQFEIAQVPDGCVDQVDHGMTPNQYGTWWFGRGGWCPGMQVEPYVVDVTDEAAPGTHATIAYQGLFNNRTPPDSSGNIALSSYLAIFR